MSMIVLTTKLLKNQVVHDVVAAFLVYDVLAVINYPLGKKACPVPE
jgi:hypothetical protein